MKSLCVVLTVIGRASAFIPRTPTTPGVRRASFVGPLSVAKIDENDHRDIASMDEWSTECGVHKAEGFALTSDDGRDWFAATTEDIPAGSAVVSVPANMVLSANLVREEYAEALSEAEEELASLDAEDQIDMFALMVKIMVEYDSGEDSAYFPWLDALPRYYYTGSSMTFACYECLPPYVSRLAMEERKKFINCQKALKHIPLSEEVTNDKNLAKWAYNAVRTRGFVAPDGDLRIVPVVDMFNHGTETEVEMQYDEEGNCYMVATKDIPANSPLRMSYGDPTNPSPLFAKYGFLDETSPATFCKLMTVEPNEELIDMGCLDFSRMLFYKDTGEVSEKVYDVLLYQVLKADRDLQRGFYEAHMNGDVETKQSYHEEYFSFTSEALRKHVDDTLRELDRLSNLARQKDVETHPRVPIILAHNEFVKKTFLTVKERLDAMAYEKEGISLL
mmetsp:Transcript_6350/g.9229  ORF Transcript_6350/g.9229 Transcript_6350/m.9229 type:complete len:447 (-) Transcript_6350:159-1499(-)|eukprot:CAMPEP_0195513754 /NCGR_PEP_ID=MMETSP0794_2-20130614/5332_1 /TAXON_ID=515487 /ORGANISM="Stephanopyxis turris, Strain CCMP 815" /LENGTH=446 /DNA_ID=CAMNT_0040641843 /DNA_START=132 /DNA_END=1472 /DNA_ORIENTATION=-